MFKKHKQLIDGFNDYLLASQTTLAEFNEAVRYVLEEGIDDHFGVLVESISNKEQTCDELRMKIEHMMYSESLLPETREDLITIIEMIDEVPNHCENVSGLIIDQNIEFYPEIKKHIIEILDLSLEIFNYVIEAANDVIGSMTRIPELARLINELRHVCYDTRRKLIRQIFNSKQHDHHYGQQLLQKDFVMDIESFSLLCSNLAEKIVIISIKRRV